MCFHIFRIRVGNPTKPSLDTFVQSWSRGPLLLSVKLYNINHDFFFAGEPRRLVRDVVLLTEDRNLRVKALARDVPVREVPDFAQWAGLG